MARLSTLEDLQKYYKPPHPVIENKGISALEQHTKTFIKHCPFVLLSSAGAEGHMDVSPRGGSAGFVKVLDDQHILIGDFPGNNRIDTMRNIMHSKSLGVLFLIPGIHEVVRLRGTATIHDDDDLLNLCIESGKKPKLVIKIALQEIFFHCPKALHTAKLWESDSFQSREILPSLGDIVKDQLGL
jgi:PPOX class probable FMN-dependent enzyme